MTYAGLSWDVHVLGLTRTSWPLVAALTIFTAIWFLFRHQLLKPVVMALVATMVAFTLTTGTASAGTVSTADSGWACKNSRLPGEIVATTRGCLRIAGPNRSREVWFIAWKVENVSAYAVPGNYYWGLITGPGVTIAGWFNFGPLALGEWGGNIVGLYKQMPRGQYCLQVDSYLFDALSACASVR